jgi:hypothetical protein
MSSTNEKDLRIIIFRKRFMGLLESKTPADRAAEFATSARFLELVKRGKELGVTVEINGLTTTVHSTTQTSESFSETTWRWEDAGCADMVYQVLEFRIGLSK